MYLLSIPKNILKMSVVFILSICLAGGTCLALEDASSNEGNDTQGLLFTKGNELLDKAFEMYYDSRAATNEIYEAFKQSQAAFGELENGYDKNYGQAMAMDGMGYVALDLDNDLQLAGQYFTTAKSFGEKALLYNKNSSDARRLLAEIYIGLIRCQLNEQDNDNYGPRLMKLLYDALDLDPNNFGVYNDLAACYIFRPEGINFYQAIGYLEKALQSKVRYENFLTHFYFGIAYELYHKKDRALEYYQKALQIYPNNTLVKSAIAKLQKS